jgi:hypothetical protein
VESYQNLDGSTEKNVLLKWENGAWHKDDRLGLTERELIIKNQISNSLNQSFQFVTAYVDFKHDEYDKKMKTLALFTTILVILSTVMSVYMK